MFNSTSYKIGGNSTTVSFNAPSTGVIQKSHPKSRFVRCAKGSKMEGWLFDENPHMQKKGKYDTWEKYADVTVLQVMVFWQDQLLVEIVHNEHFIDEPQP